MEDLTLALVTLTSFVLLFVVAIFADRAGADLDASQGEPVLVPAERMTTSTTQSTGSTTAARPDFPSRSADVA